jgi:hypothetical protein
LWYNGIRSFSTKSGRCASTPSLLVCTHQRTANVNERARADAEIAFLGDAVGSEQTSIDREW